LEPLRGSTVLEKLDLELNQECYSSLSSDEDVLETKLSYEVVCDIVEGILGTDDNNFQRLQLPRKFWTHDFPPVFEGSEKLTQLMNYHCALLISSSKCLYFGIDDEEELCLLLCDENGYVTGDVVDECFFCESASYFACSHCQTLLCKNCSSHGKTYRVDEEPCLGCGASSADYCSQCIGSGFGIELITCQGDDLADDWGCWKTRCSSCLVNSLRDRGSECRACYEIGFDALVEEDNARRKKITEQLAEIEANREVIKKLEDWNEELQTEKEEQQEEIMKLQQELKELRMKVDGKSA